MPIAPRLSVVTLGVSDVNASTEFYRGLGWRPAEGSVPGVITFFQLQGAILALFGNADLARDANVDDGSDGDGTGSGRPQPLVTLAMNMDSRAEVDQALARAVECGAKLVKAGEAAEWGGYSGYFTDRDGHLWEVAHNPGWPIGPSGVPQVDG